MKYLVVSIVGAIILIPEWCLCKVVMQILHDAMNKAENLKEFDDWCNNEL